MPGVAGVGGQPGHVGVVGVQLEAVDPLGIAVEDDELAAERVHRMAEQLAGAAVPRDEHERLRQPGDLAGEALQRQRLPEGAVLQQGSSEPIA